MIRNFFLRLYKGKHRQGRFYRWIVPLALGEMRWIRRLEIAYLSFTSLRRYRNWIKHAEIGNLDLHNQALSHAERPSPPRFLVILIVKEQEALDLPKTSRNLQNQNYEYWNLRFLFIGNSGHEFLEQAGSISDKDERIECIVCDEKLNPTDWISQELEVDEFDFVVFLDADGFLAPQALYEFRKVIVEHPEVDWIYSDEDVVDSNSARYSPWFKPDWSPELLLSINYLSPAVIRGEIIAKCLEDKHEELEDSWLESPLYFLDFKSTKVQHCPKVLYHRSRTRDWKSPERKPDHQHRTWVKQYLTRSGCRDAQIVVSDSGEITFSYSPNDALVSIIIPTKDNLPILRRCIGSIIDLTCYSNYRLILIDTGSVLEGTNEFFEEISMNPKVEIRRYEQEFNYSAVNNFGARNAEGNYFLFLNDDIEVVEGDWIGKLLQLAQLPDIGVVGARLTFPNDTIQHNGIILGLGGHAGHVFRGADEGVGNPFGSTQWYRNVLAVTGACMMVPRDVFETLGGFDEEYKLVFSDVEFCLQAIEHGYRVVLSPFTRLIHHEGATRGRYMPFLDLELARNRFLPYLQSGDPYYNPNLSYHRTYPRIRGFDELNRVDRVSQIMERMIPSSGLKKT